MPDLRAGLWLSFLGILAPRCLPPVTKQEPSLSDCLHDRVHKSWLASARLSPSPPVSVGLQTIPELSTISLSLEDVPQDDTLYLFRQIWCRLRIPHTGDYPTTQSVRIITQFTPPKKNCLSCCHCHCFHPHPHHHQTKSLHHATFRIQGMAQTEQ